MVWKLKTFYNTLTEMWEPWSYAFWGFLLSARDAFREGRYRDLLRVRKLLDAGFYWWCKTLNHHFLRYERNTTPLPQLVGSCKGVVLELGPGMGNQLFFLDKTKVTRVVGIECNPNFVPEVQAQIRERGLEDIYELVLGGVEDADLLARHGVTPGSLDTVLSTGVLCSVPDPDAIAREMYMMLKPGGRLIFWEHHRSPDWATAISQSLWNPLWRPVVGGCNLNRDILGILLRAGKWENLESIRDDAKENPGAMLPRVWGELVKPRE